MEPRSLAALTRAVLLGQHLLYAVLLLVAWGRAADDQPWFEAVAAGLGVLYAAHALVEARSVAVAPPSPPPSAAAPGSEARLVALALLGLLLLAWFASLTLTPDFAWLGLPLSFVVLRGLRSAAALPVIAAMVLAVIWSHARVTGWSEIGLAPVAGPLVGAFISIGMSQLYRMLLREGAARQQLLDELTATRTELEATRERLAESRRETDSLEEQQAHLSREGHDTAAPAFGSVVTHSGFAAALERLVSNVGQHSGIRTSFAEEDGGRALPRSHEVALLRLAQGALANVTAHSGATRVTVSLSVLDDGTTLDIVDDGIGFQPHDMGPREDGSGYGLRSMRERITALGGELTVESAPSRGTAIAAHLPAQQTSR